MNMMKKFGVAAAIALTAISANGEAVDGCYGRMYSIAHMKSNPEQTLSAFMVNLYSDKESDDGQMMNLQAHFARTSTNITESVAGEVFSSGAFCFQPEVMDFDEEPYLTLKKESVFACGIECDGGIAYVTEMTDTKLTIKTNYLRLDNRQFAMEDDDEAACGTTYGLGDLDSDGDHIFTTYVLYRMDDAACEGIE